MTAATPEPLPRIIGHPTHVRELGRGLRRALFLHASLAHSGDWTKVQAELLDKLSMIAFDRPGHGRSAAWNGEGGPVGLLDLTAQIAGRLAGKPIDIVGHSFGGLAALRLAMTRPELVRSLTLIEPPLFAILRGTPVYDAHAAAMAGFASALAAGDSIRAAQIFQDEVNPDTPFARVPDAVRAGLARRIGTIADELPVTMEDVAGLLGPGKLEAIKVPILLLQGSASPPIFSETIAALAARMPKARRVIAIGAGHMAPITHPVNVAGEIAAFLKV